MGKRRRKRGVLSPVFGETVVPHGYQYCDLCHVTLKCFVLILLETVLKRRLFDENTQISEVGLGCWQLGGLCWGDLDEERAFEIMQVSVDQGVTFFDTADVYGAGRSETLIGAFLKKCPHDIFVATKLGRFAQPGWPYNFSKESMTRHTEASLSRLGVEALDLTQLHCIPTRVMQQGEAFIKARWPDVQTKRQN